MMRESIRSSNTVDRPSSHDAEDRCRGFVHELPAIHSPRESFSQA
jgi:hypothetical protein